MADKCHTLFLSAQRVREYCVAARTEVEATADALRQQLRSDDLVRFRLARLDDNAQGLAALLVRAEAAIAESPTARLAVSAAEFTLITSQWSKIRNQRRDFDLVVYGWLTRKFDRSDKPLPVLFLVPGHDELTSALAKMRERTEAMAFSPVGAG